jgi:hypothetical protein
VKDLKCDVWYFGTGSVFVGCLWGDGLCSVIELVYVGNCVRGGGDDLIVFDGGWIWIHDSNRKLIDSGVDIEYRMWSGMSVSFGGGAFTLV